MTLGGTRTDRFRILHLIPTLEVGGAQRQLRLLALEQARQGYEVHVGLLRGGPNQDALVGSDVRCHWLGHRGHHDPRLVSGILRLIRGCHPDLVQTWLTQMDVLGGWAARVSRIPWVLTERSSAGAYPPTIKNWARARVGVGASAIVANSAGGRSYWRTVRGLRAPVSVVPNAVAIDEIDRTPPVPSVPDGVPTLLFVGRFAEVKNIPLLVDAFHRLLARMEAVLVLCGDGPERGQIEDRVRSYGIEGRVQLLGFRDDVIGRLKAASAFVSLSRYEGCPNAALEAMASGCPMVLSDIPAHREIVDDLTGQLVDPANTDAVATALLTTLRDRDGTAARVRTARQAVEGYSPSAAANRFAELYRQAIDASSAPRRRTVGRTG